MTVVTWRLQLKVTHLFHRHAKMVQMSSGTFCTALHCLCSSEKKRKTLVYVCIMCNLRCASLYMALHEANYVHVGYIMCCLPLCRLMAVLHESLNTSNVPHLPVSWWILFCLWFYAHKRISHICTIICSTHMICAHFDTFFFLISTRATKSNSNTYFLGDGDKSCVGGVS